MSADLDLAYPSAVEVARRVRSSELSPVDTTPTRGHVTTLGSWTQGNRISEHDAHIVDSL